MTDAATRRRLVDLSVVATSAIVLGAAFVVAADVDHARAPLTASPEVARAGQASPVAGLVPAPRPAQRRAVTRRSRAS